MHTNAIRFVLLAFSFSLALGQSAMQPSQEQAFQLAHTQDVQSAQEIAAVIKIIADINQVRLSTESTPLTLTVGGTAEQLALAEWLLVELDRPAPGQLDPVMREYRLPGVGENVVRVYSATHTSTEQELQELATAIHTITALRLLTTHNAQRAVVVRGTADQVAVSKWLLDQMDKLGNEPVRHSSTGRYLMPDPKDQGVVQVFFVAHTGSVRDFQEFATVMRTVAMVRFVFPYNAPRALAMRGTAGQIAVAEWLFGVLDQPKISSQTSPPQGNDATALTYRVSGSIDDVVRVFYLTRAATLEDFQKAAAQVRTATRIPWVFTYNVPRSIVLRGTTAQIAQAEHLIEEMNKP
jgi:hypothetical protein